MMKEYLAGNHAMFSKPFHHFWSYSCNTAQLSGRHSHVYALAQLRRRLSEIFMLSVLKISPLIHESLAYDLSILLKEGPRGRPRDKRAKAPSWPRTWEPSLYERLHSGKTITNRKYKSKQKLLRRLLFLVNFLSVLRESFAWMFQRCESLQEQCRRVLIRSVGSRKLLPKLPLPRNVIAWLKEYEEPAAFDPNCSSDEVVFSNNNETITFNGQLQSQLLI